MDEQQSAHEPAYLVAELAQLLATDHRVAELGLTVTLDEGVVHVRGRIAGPDCRAKVDEVIAEAAPDLDVVTEVECADLAEPTEGDAEVLS